MNLGFSQKLALLSLLLFLFSIPSNSQFWLSDWRKRPPVEPSLAAVTDPSDWPQVGRDAQHSNYSLVQVDPPYCYAWKWYEAPLASRAQPVVSAGRLFIGSMEGTLFARNATTGALLWRYETGSPIRNAAAVSGERVLFTTHAGETYALETGSGNLLWRRRTGSSSTAPLVDMERDQVIVASSTGDLTALRLVDGETNWTYFAGAPILTTPALSVDGQTIFLASENIDAIAVEAASGEERWRTPLQGQSLADRYPVVSGDTVFYRSQPLYFFHTLLHEGDQTMDLAGGWSTSFNPTVWAADWANVRPHILTYLNSEPAKLTFFALNTATGVSRGVLPILYTYGNNDIANLPVARNNEIYLTYRARHGIQTDSNTVHVSSKYDAELGQLNLGSLDITPLTSNAPISGVAEWRMTSDEPAMLTMGGNILWVDNWERLGGFDVNTHTNIHVGNVSNTWPECLAPTCGPGSPMPFFPLVEGQQAYPFPSPRVSEGHQRAGVVVANGMLYWRVIEGGLAAISHRSGAACPAPLVYGLVSPPPPPTYQTGTQRLLEDYLSLDLTTPNPSPPAELVTRLKNEVQQLVTGNAHWMPLYLERGFTNTSVWPYNTNDPDDLPDISYNAHGNAYFHDPGDLLVTLAMAYPYLDSSLQTQTRSYLTAENTRFPPLQDLPYGGSGDQDWLGQGSARERYNVPMRNELNNWPPVRASLNALYGLWLWSMNTGDWTYAQAHWPEAVALFQARTPVDHAAGKIDYFADLAGLIGFARMAEHFGDTARYNQARSVTLAAMQDMINNTQAYLDRADNEYLDARGIASGWYAPALFGLTPEVGLFLREQTGGQVQQYLIDKEYGVNGDGLRWWYLTRAGTHAEAGETSFVAPNAAWSHYLGHAFLLGDPRENLVAWLDIPWGKGGDLYSIQKLVAAIQAASITDYPYKLHLPMVTR